MSRSAPILFLLLIPSCTVIAPPEDFPQIPLPERIDTDNLRTSVTLREDGTAVMQKTEYIKLVSLIYKIINERDILREMVDRYNRWSRGE